jgi:acyl-ACP thioesterase
MVLWCRPTTVLRCEGQAMKLALPEHKKQVFELVIPIRWGDMDAMGHVNNTVYFPLHGDAAHRLV